MEDRISVRLIGPAKVGGRWCRSGEDVAVTQDQARELAALGVISEGEGNLLAELAPGMPGFDQAVAAMAKTLADAAVHAALEAAHSELIADRDAARIRASDAEAEVGRQHARIMELEVELADSESLRKALAEENAALKSVEQTAGDEAAGNTTRTARKKAAPPVEQKQG